MAAAILACSKLSLEKPAARSVMLSQVLSQLRCHQLCQAIIFAGYYKLQLVNV